MNKSKTKKLALLATVTILLLAFIPPANAGFPGHMRDRPWYTNLLQPWWQGEPDWPFLASEDLYFRIGWATWWIELENDWAPKWPYQFKLFINDEEIPIQRYEIPVAKEDKEIIAKISYWYHVFGPDYFTVGEEYLLRFEFWVRRPYQGYMNEEYTTRNEWRIFRNYDPELVADFGPVGIPMSIEYYLNIVESYPPWWPF